MNSDQRLSRMFEKKKNQSFFFKKQYEIEEKIHHFLRCMEDMGLLYQEAFFSYFSQQADQFQDQVKELGAIEKKMDELGRQIQISLFAQSLMPDSREDILWLLNSLDQIPSLFKHSLRDIQIEKPVVPETLHDLFRQMLTKTGLTISKLVQATDALFADLRSVRLLTEEVSRHESEVDKVELRLLQAVFDQEDLELVRKYQIKRLIQYIGSISNTAEDVSDAILIFAIKRAM
ncbi:MAG: DUF47 family protein [SAR324 cluster bacterium]|nr:DUF47 family protein [SAR324 cluster bacterium]